MSLLPFMEPIHVIGAGAIGLHWASSIRRAFPSYPICCFFRDRHRSSPLFLKAGSSSNAEKSSASQACSALSGLGSATNTTNPSGRIFEKEIVVCTRKKYLSADDEETTEIPSNNKNGGSGQVSFRVVGRGGGSKSNITTSAAPPRPSRRGTRLLQQRSQPRMARVPFQFIPDDDNRRRKITNLLVCTKAYQAKDAILSVLPRLDTMAKNLKIIILSNGALDIRDQLVHDDTFSTFCAQVSSSHQRRPELVLCSTTHGVELDKSSHKSYNIDDDHDDDGGDDMFHILEVGEGGKTYIGGHPQIARLWDQSGLTTQSIPPEQMEALLWHKLCANCVCNPLTAIWNIANGQLAYVHPELFASIRKHVIEEVSNVGYASLEQQGFWDDFPNLYNQKSSLLSPLVLDDFISTVIEAHLRNTSSMCRDVLRGQRTEVENLNGFVVRKGLEFGLPTPANAELVQKVQEMTNASAR